MGGKVTLSRSGASMPVQAQSPLWGLTSQDSQADGGTGVLCSGFRKPGCSCTGSGGSRGRVSSRSSVLGGVLCWTRSRAAVLYACDPVPAVHGWTLRVAVESPWGEERCGRRVKGPEGGGPAPYPAPSSAVAGPVGGHRTRWLCAKQEVAEALKVQGSGGGGSALVGSVSWGRGDSLAVLGAAWDCGPLF